MINFLTIFFNSPEIFERLPDHERSGAGVFSRIVQAISGNVLCYADTQFTSLGQAMPLGGNMMSVHCGHLRSGRRLAVEKTRQMGDAIFADFPGLAALVGFTPTEFRGAVHLAKKAGFVQQGIVSKSFRYHEQMLDQAILVKERSDG